MDPLENVAVKILGYSVKTRWQICLNYLIPCIIELLVYISVIVIDSALVFQHILDKNFLWGWLTLGVTIIPAILTFICVIVSNQWPIEEGFGSEKRNFFYRQIVNLFAFPIGAIYRLSHNSMLINKDKFYSFLDSHAKSFGVLTVYFTIEIIMRDITHSQKQRKIHPLNFIIFFRLSSIPVLK